MDKRRSIYKNFISNIISNKNQNYTHSNPSGETNEDDIDQNYTFDVFDANIGQNENRDEHNNQNQKHNLVEDGIYDDNGLNNDENSYPVELIADIMGSSIKTGNFDNKSKKDNDSNNNNSINEKKIIFLHEGVQPEYLKVKNKVSNTKYNLLTFFPLCLLSQLMSPLSAFFIYLAILQIFPIFRIGTLLGFIFPPIFCFVITMIVEGLGDLGRKQRDKEENSTPVRVLKGNKLEYIGSGELTVGDIVVLGDGEAATFNGIALAPFRRNQLHNQNESNTIISTQNINKTSESNDHNVNEKINATIESKPVNFYIRTDQLDGETDWKHRKCVFSTQMYSQNISDISSIFVLDSYSTTTSYPCSSKGNIGKWIKFKDNTDNLVDNLGIENKIDNEDNNLNIINTLENNSYANNDTTIEVCQNISNECVIPCGCALQSPEPILVLMAGTNNMCPKPCEGGKRISLKKIKNSFKGTTSSSLRIDLSDKNINICSGYIFVLIFVIFSLPMCMIDYFRNDAGNRNSQFGTFTNILVSYVCSIVLYSVCLPSSLQICMKAARAVNNGSTEFKDKLKGFMRKKSKNNKNQGEMFNDKDGNFDNNIESRKINKGKPLKLHTQDDYTKGTSVISLGRIGCLLSDKTGTLTTNEMHLYGYKKMEKGDIIEEEVVCDNQWDNNKSSGTLAASVNVGFNSIQKYIPKQVLGFFNGQQEQRLNETTEIDDVINNAANIRAREDIVDRNICSGAGICIINNGNYIPILNPRDMMEKAKENTSDLEDDDINDYNENYNDDEKDIDSEFSSNDKKRKRGNKKKDKNGKIIKDSRKKSSSKTVTLRSCVREFLLCNSVYVDGSDWGESMSGIPKSTPTFRASSPEEVALAEFCYMNTSTTIARREEKDVVLNIVDNSTKDGDEINHMTVPCILTFEWPTNSHSLSNTNIIKVREFAILHVIPFNSVLKRMSVIVQRIKKYNVNADNEEELKCLWDTSKKPYNYGKIRVITKGADSAIIPLLAKRNNSINNSNNNNNNSDKLNSIPSATALLQSSDTYARGGLRTLAFCERTLNDKEFLDIYKLIRTANNSSHTQEILKKINEIIPYESTASCVVGIEDKLQRGVRESIVNLRSAGIPVWMLTGDKVETALTVASQCGIIADVSHTFIFKEDETGIDPLLTLAQKVNSPRRNTCGMITVCANSDDVTALQREYLLPRFISLLMKADSVVLCRLTPEQKEIVAKLVGGELKKQDMGVCAIGDGGNDVKMIKEAEVGIGIVGKEGRMAALASDVAVSSFENAQKCILVAGYSAYYRYSSMWKVLVTRGIRLGFISVFIVAVSGFLPQTPISSLTNICYATFFSGIPLLLMVWDYGEQINYKHILNKISRSKQSRKLPCYTQTKNKGLIKPSLYNDQAKKTIISLGTLIRLVGVAFIQSIIIFAIFYPIYGIQSCSAIMLSLVGCCLWDSIEAAEKKSVAIVVSVLLSLLFTVVALAFVDKGMPSSLTFVQMCLSLLIVALVSLPPTLLRKKGIGVWRGAFAASKLK